MASAGLESALAKRLRVEHSRSNREEQELLQWVANGTPKLSRREVQAMADERLDQRKPLTPRAFKRRHATA